MPSLAGPASVVAAPRCRTVSIAKKDSATNAMIGNLELIMVATFAD